MYYLKHLWLKARHNSILRLVFDGLAKLGVKIQPYYIVVEGLFNRSLPHLETGFDEYEIGFLGPQYMNEISAIPGRILSEEKLLLRLKEGKKCFGLKYRKELVAFTWCDFDECNFKGFRFPLKKNEAYLYDAYTLIPFRGKGIAPYLRYQCYKELAKLGRNKLYSISDCLNTPSVRFKKKLNAELLELCLFVEMFKKWHFSSRLKKYRPET